MKDGKARIVPEMDGRAMINGNWIETQATMAVINPANGKSIGKIRICGKDEVEKAVESARKASPGWAKIGIRKRIAIMEKSREYLLEEFDEIAETETLETGKPLALAKMGPLYALLAIDFYCKNAERFLEDEEIPTTMTASAIMMPRKTYVAFSPKGVIAIILPWNFPVMLGMLSIVPALIAGNSVVLKPSSYAPFTVSRIVKILEKAGLPKGVINLVHGHGSETGEILTGSDVDKVVFTGSPDSGKKVAARCAERLCPFVLELGGLDPMIVLEDADIDEATNGAVFGSFMNSGQTCTAAKRVFVHKKIAKRFVDLVVEKTNRLSIGDGLEENDIGPLISSKRLASVERFVKDAVEKGAKVETGGKRLDRPGFFFQPTILTNVKDDMLVMREEPFGPIMPISEFGNEEDAISFANDTLYGLGASVWSRNTEKAEMIARSIEAGTVWINDVSLPFVNAPFGGVKKSGLGKEGGKEGIRGMCNEKVVSLVRFRAKNRLWWFPFSRNLENQLSKAAKGMFGKGIFERSKNMLSLANNMLNPGEGKKARINI